MKFSVIIPTLNRVEEPLLLLDSLVEQTYKNFEVILVDQNEDGKLDEHIKTYKNKFPLKHIKTEIKGASNARNTGIKKSLGEILTFPDDDCEFYESFLEEINYHFNNSKNDGILITTKDKYDGKAISILMSSKSQKIYKKNVLKTVIEAGIIVKAKKLDGFLFDPEMGVGSPISPYWSDEGPDLIIRLLEKGLNFEFCPQYYMFHPNPVKIYNEKTALRSYRYGKGRGYLLKKHNFGFLSILYYLLMYIVGMLKGILMLNTKMFKYFRKGFLGRYEGYFLSK
jgi:glycosyltransferase involved in cell wall biosynthesis